MPWKKVNTDGTRATNWLQSLEKNKKKLGKTKWKQASKRSMFLWDLGLLTNLTMVKGTQPLVEQAVTVNLAGE